MPESDPELAWQGKLNNGEYVSVNPNSAEILHRYDYYSTFYGFTMAIHRWLLYQDGDNERPLRNWVSVSALVLLLEVIVGFYLWVKPKNRIKRLAIKRRAKFRILMYQLHTVLGVYLAIPLILIAFSGMAFNWKSATQQVVETVTFSKVEKRPVPEPFRRTYAPVTIDTPIKMPWGFLIVIISHLLSKKFRRSHRFHNAKPRRVSRLQLGLDKPSKWRNNGLLRCIKSECSDAGLELQIQVSHWWFRGPIAWIYLVINRITPCVFYDNRVLLLV